MTAGDSRKSSDPQYSISGSPLGFRISFPGKEVSLSGLLNAESAEDALLGAGSGDASSNAGMSCKGLRPCVSTTTTTGVSACVISPGGCSESDARLVAI